MSDYANVISEVPLNERPNEFSGWVYIVWVDDKIHACWSSALSAARSISVDPSQALPRARLLNKGEIVRFERGYVERKGIRK